MQKVNLRDDPSVNGRIIRTVSSGEILTALKISQDDKWMKVADPSGGKGWLWKKFIVFY